MKRLKGKKAEGLRQKAEGKKFFSPQPSTLSLQPNFFTSLPLSLLTVLLLSLSFPSPDCGYLAWIALVPWFITISRGEGSVAVPSGIVGGVFFIVNLYWLYYVTPLGWILLGLYCGGYFLAFGLAARFVIQRTRLPLTAFAPFLWVSFEYLRSFILSGFPWFFIGHTQYSFLHVIQIADITGVYGISFIIVLVNACIMEIILAFLKKVRQRDSGDHFVGALISTDIKLKARHFWGGSVVYLLLPLTIVIVILSIFYGCFKLKGYQPLEGPTICVVQGNIPQSLKMDTSEEQQEKNLKKYFSLSEQAIGKDIDLLVWPETMVPGLLNINPALTGREIDKLSHDSVKTLVLQAKSNLLLGGTAIGLTGEDEQRFYNSAFFYNRNGKLIDRYDKIHLVPFGEYTPLKSIFPFLARLVPYEVGISSGSRRTIFELDTVHGNNYRFGVVICYEDTVAPLVRDFKKGGADFILNITNDGWFHDSAELNQHLAIMVFRAVENRVGIARAANTGISSFVSPNGEIYAQLTKDNKRREIEGTLISKIMLHEKGSISWYTSYGDIFALFCITVSFVMLPGLTFYPVLRRNLENLLHK
ncbi:MAG TPA: apolipoprotein N-acyltransferase [Candidatus Brocadiia bacterium]|nr:apolipoprotein N-acyltransferase [Candidatus Brocadiales bacterium]